MLRVVTIVACGLTLAACSSSWTPSLDFLTPAPQLLTARFESEPPGAEARTSGGQTCRTPCALALPAQDFSVTFALNGYLPQTVPVSVHLPTYQRDSENVDQADFRPNPVIAALDPAPPPPRKKKRRRRTKKPPVAARAPARAPVQRSAPPRAAPPPAAAPAPASPWPATR